MPTELTQHEGNVRMHKEEARRRRERVLCVPLQSLKTVTSNKPGVGGFLGRRVNFCEIVI